MDIRKKALFLGDYSEPAYHPAKDVDVLIKEVLKEDFEVICTEDYGNLTIEDLKPYSLIINYADRWDKKGSKKTIAALLTFVVNGGGIVGIHNGIIAPIEGGSEILHLLSGRFLNHPEYSSMDYYKTIGFKDHPIMEDFEPFTLSDEPYMFELDAIGHRHMLLDYRWNGQRYPAAWTVNYGLGRVVYLAPGHDLRSFQVSGFQKLISKSAVWAAKI